MDNDTKLALFKRIGRLKQVTQKEKLDAVRILKQDEDLLAVILPTMEIEDPMELEATLVESVKNLAESTVHSLLSISIFPLQ
jgi:hypothetical protein